MNFQHNQIYTDMFQKNTHKKKDTRTILYKRKKKKKKKILWRDAVLNAGPSAFQESAITTELVSQLTAYGLIYLFITFRYQPRAAFRLPSAKSEKKNKLAF